MTTDMKKIEIYVHVPFCESKCCYCSFASFVCEDKLKKDYFEFLLKEIDSCKYKNRECVSIYIGGGTPSCVDVQYIGDILKTIRRNFKVTENAEISIECNPNSADKTKLKAYRALGINRISFGVQSLDNKTLRFLGRRHNNKQAIKAIKLAQTVGFSNISADLLIGASFNSKRLIKDACKLVKLGITHLSAYMLQIEENTPLCIGVEKGEVVLPNEDQCVCMYQQLVKKLEKKKFYRYEISNFSKKGFECIHNLGYWSGEEYVGFGLSAHSYVNGVRMANARSFSDYFAGKQEKEVLSNSQKIEEYIMLGLRCSLGISKSKLKKLGYDIESNKNYSLLLKQKVLFLKDDIINLNPDFYGVCNLVIVKLLP